MNVIEKRETKIIHTRILAYLKHYGMENDLLQKVKDDLGQNTASENYNTEERNGVTIQELQERRKDKTKNQYITVTYQNALQRDSLEWQRNQN